MATDLALEAAEAAVREAEDALPKYIDTVEPQSSERLLGAAILGIGLTPNIENLGQAKEVPMAVQQLGEYAETLSPSVTRALSFGEPRVHIETRGQTRAPEITDWRAYLQLTNADDPAVVVLAGSVDFLVVRIGAGDIPAMLAAAPARGEPASDPAHFAGLFDGPDLAADVEEQFDDALAINTCC